MALNLSTAAMNQDSRCIDLAVAGLEKQYTGVSCSSKQLQTFLRKLHPQLACLRSAL